METRYSQVNVCVRLRVICVVARQNGMEQTEFGGWKENGIISYSIANT